MNEPRSIHAAEDWGVVLQSVPSKNKRETVKRLEEIFGIDKHDAEQILSNMPLILVDNLSFGLAARIKKFFQKVGAVAETTNHDMIKKNCFQVLWPQTPDLSYFMKNETGPAEATDQERKSSAKPAEIPRVEKKAESDEAEPGMPKIHEAPLSVKSEHESSNVVSRSAPISQKPAEELPKIVPHIPPVPPKLVQESPAVVPHHPPVPDEKQAAALSSGVDSDWERRAKELNEKLRKIHEEKQELHVQHVEATEKVKSEFQQRLEEEKKKSGEIAKAYEDLQVEAQKHEALTREGEEWRDKAVALGEKVRELETNLMQKISAVEHLIHEKEELSQKIEGLERNVKKMTDSMCSRDSVLAQFEKQILELAEKVQGYESLRQEHAKLAQERATIRQEHDAKLAEQEVRFAKIEDDQRRYRSRADRKTAAATRELGEWVRNVDAVRQGLQKLILFLGSESAELDSEKKSHLKSPLTRGTAGPKVGKD